MMINPTSRISTAHPRTTYQFEKVDIRAPPNVAAPNTAPELVVVDDISDISNI